MPRRKKNGQSPARVPGGPPEGGSLGQNTGCRVPQGFDGAMANNFPSSTALSSAVKERIVKSMQEMFSNLDREVIYIVLSECDFKVENAMDSLLELSVAAEGAPPIPSPVSGFERTAAALLSPHHFSESGTDPDSSKPQRPSSPSCADLLTEELDLLVDQELETLITQQDTMEEHHSSLYLSSVIPLPLQQQVLPEQLPSSLQPGCVGPSSGLVEHTSGASSPVNQLSTWEDETVEEQQAMLGVTHQMAEMPADRPKPPLDLAASGRPSAFQVYKKQEPSQILSDEAEVLPAKSVVEGARSKVAMLNQEPHGYTQPLWNLEAPVFSPHVHENQGPAFITPVVQPPSNWSHHSRHASPWLNQGPVSQAPLKPYATIPKSWVLPAPQPAAQYNRLRLQGRVLVLLRGAPGSGKSTLARALVEHNPGAVKLSTDDYFTCHGRYQFDPGALGEAHGWNQDRAKEAFERGANPIIIDNTNMQGWEMRPYVVQALKHRYKVLFREPDTWWKNKPRELERRSTHKVPLETIRRMLNGYERFVSVQSIMGSQMPELKVHLPLDNQSSQPMSPEAPCPDLVGQPGLTEGCKKSCPQLFSSLPDVSSIDHDSEVGMLEDDVRKSTESLDFHPTERLIEKPEVSDWDNDMDLGKLDPELEAQLELSRPTGDQRIPDCIVESVINQDRHEDEVSVAFSESIGQRVRRARPRWMSGFDMLEPADLVKSTIQSDSETGEKERTKEEEAEGLELVRDGGEQAMPKMLDFAGDWPTEMTLKQRPVRRRESHKEGNGKKDESMSQKVNNNRAKVQPGPNIIEFQKLLDLIQTGVADIQTTSSPSSSFSPSSEGEPEKDKEAYGRFEGSHRSRSNSEERKQTVMADSSRSELPDCVLDWKAADVCKVKESRIDDWEGLQTENKVSSVRGANDDVFEIGKEAESLDLKPTISLSPLADPCVISKSVEANLCQEGEGNQGEGGVGTEPGSGPADVDTNNCTQNDRNTSFEADYSHISELCQSPVCEGSVEAESGACSGGSQERKLRQGRRSGKQCKLALTFTQNCPASSLNTLECLNNTDQNMNSGQKNFETDVEPNLNHNRYTSVSLEPNLDLFVESKFEAHLQPPSPLTTVGRCCPTQTEPQDFALLWRLNHQDNPDEAVLTAYSHPFHIIVPSGNSSHFVPELPAASSTAPLPSLHRDVPYRVVHEKSTQVEEKELGATQDRLESLRILSGHFKLVSFDTLEDLYDKCHQDLEWTTNLLLDSGEMFFKDEDSEKKDDGAGREEDQKASRLCGALDKPVETRLSSDVKDEHHVEDWLTDFEAGTQQSSFQTGESDERSSNANGLNFGGTLIPVNNKDRPDTTSHLEKAPQTVNEGGERYGLTTNKVESEKDREGSAWGGCFDDGAIIEESVVETEEEIADREETHWLPQAELDKLEREERQKERSERRHREEGKIQRVDIQSVELKLPTEVALQLTELFGPVGVDPGTCSTDDNVVQMDLNLAKLLHQKWKETIQEKQRQTTLSLHLLQDGPVNWAESQVAKGYTSLENQPEGCSQMPFMDHWNVFRPHISLRDIIKEEQALQENMEKTRQSRADLDWCDGATLLKKDQLYSHFPSIDRHFLQDIFRDHNYSLSQTKLFLHSLLDEEPVKTVVAPEAPRYRHQRAASKEREMKQKPLESIKPDYQDTEDPEYEDFRAEASLQRRRQLESFSKAADAFKQGRKEVASYYAQQGHLHGERMHEAHHRAAVQIFERVNSSLLPKNILDLHGLHVHEALEHLAQVLQDKTIACEQGLCRPQLSVITGRGNHSQGGVARIRPAVINYLTNNHYRFTEPKPGLVLVSLK